MDTRHRLTAAQEEAEEFCITLECLRDTDPAAFERIWAAVLQVLADFGSDGHGKGGLRGYIESAVKQYPQFSYLLDQLHPSLN